MFVFSSNSASSIVKCVFFIDMLTSTPCSEARSTIYSNITRGPIPVRPMFDEINERKSMLSFAQVPVTYL